jgi:inorganic triphosphatase YgiF
MTYETETCLLVVGEDPAAIMRQVGSLELLAGQSLQSAGTWTQRDVYVDTPDGALRQQGFGLRLRTRDGSDEVLTLKGPPVASGGASTTRLEIEGTSRVIQALRNAGIDVHPQDMAPLQTRITQRTALCVGTSIELVLDVVTYEVGEQHVLHYEIEIEALSPDATHRIEAMTEALLNEFKHLRTWPHSKLATGLALESLHARDVLLDGIHHKGHPTATLYDAIERELSEM